MMTCPNCPQVPVVSQRLARQVLDAIPPPRREALKILAMKWLLDSSHGLHVYAGVTGRDYTGEERKAVSLETALASQTACPFFYSGECLLDGLGLHYNRVEEANSAPYAWLPTWVARAWSRREARALTARGLVADVKACTLTRNELFLSRDVSGAVIVA